MWVVSGRCGICVFPYLNPCSLRTCWWGNLGLSVVEGIVGWWGGSHRRQAPFQPYKTNITFLDSLLIVFHKSVWLI